MTRWTPQVTGLVDRIAQEVGAEWRDECESAPVRAIEDVWPRYAIWLLTVEAPSKHGRKVAALYERVLRGDEPTAAEWRGAYAASISTYADAARFAAGAARYAAADYAARYAARYAACYAAAVAERKTQLNELRPFWTAWAKEA